MPSRTTSAHILQTQQEEEDRVQVNSGVGLSRLHPLPEGHVSRPSAPPAMYCMTRETLDAPHVPHKLGPKNQSKLFVTRHLLTVLDLDI